jgi:hypothetical protein
LQEQAANHHKVKLVHAWTDRRTHLRLAGLAERAEGVGERGGVRPAAAAPALRRQDVEQGEEVALACDVGERPHHGVLGAGALVHHHHDALPPRRGRLLRPAEPAAAAVAAGPRLLPGPAPRPAPAAAAALPLLLQRAAAIAGAQLPQEVLAAAPAAPHRSISCPAASQDTHGACAPRGSVCVWVGVVSSAGLWLWCACVRDVTLSLVFEVEAATGAS